MDRAGGGETDAGKLMGRILKIVGIGLIILLIVLQFFRPEPNDEPVETEQDLLTVVSPPDHITSMLKNACYDCHSNRTVYPWYQKVSPVSWYLYRHIEKGKKDLNFSDYGGLDKADRIGLLVETCEVLETGTMPLQSYLLLHKEARLSQENRDALCNWTEEEALKVMRE